MVARRARALFPDTPVSTTYLPPGRKTVATATGGVMSRETIMDRLNLNPALKFALEKLSLTDRVTYIEGIIDVACKTDLARMPSTSEQNQKFDSNILKPLIECLWLAVRDQCLSSLKADASLEDQDKAKIFVVEEYARRAISLYKKLPDNTVKPNLESTREDLIDTVVMAWAVTGDHKVAIILFKRLNFLYCESNHCIYREQIEESIRKNNEKCVPERIVETIKQTHDFVHDNLFRALAKGWARTTPIEELHVVMERILA